MKNKRKTEYAKGKESICIKKGKCQCSFGHVEEGKQMWKTKRNWREDKKKKES